MLIDKIPKLPYPLKDDNCSFCKYVLRPAFWYVMLEVWVLGILLLVKLVME